jgi:thioredoxin 1
MATVDATQQNFAELVSNNPMVIVDFWAPWCGPCRSFAPIYEELSEKNTDIVFAKINTEQEQVLAGHFQIRSIPTLMVFREQIIIFAQPGALPGAALEKIIDKAKSLDMDQVRRDIEAQQAGDGQAG